MLAGGVVLLLFGYHLDVLDESLDRSRQALTREIARSELAVRASDTARQIDAFLTSRILEAKVWASSPIVIDAARSAARKHQAEGLTNAAIGNVERRFRTQKSLGLWPRADSHLRQQVAESPYFAEIFFTDRNGFNVAMTSQTSDFVQSDESWWKSAWAHGASLGEVEYDESAGVWSVAISIRIDSPGGDTPLGVMKTVLAIEAVQNIADRAAREVSVGRVVVATGQGALIAETASGHDPQRIMNGDIDLREQGEPSTRDSFDGDRSGYAVGRSWLTGYARIGGHEVDARTIGGFSGLDWIVIVQKPLTAIHEPIAALRGIEDALHDWPLILAVAFGATIFLCAGMAVVLSAASARRLASALAAVGEMADCAARGAPASPPVIEDPEEIVRVSDAVRRLSGLRDPFPLPGDAR
ncbi:MAG: cache domain-containing protein [Defluviicoccus sp.]|nr:cache domain-containing protein [Defluviicoccus sp.]MDE0382393.1 cache domain-containing protein [Defluviicoccus sp.]